MRGSVFAIGVLLFQCGVASAEAPAPSSFAQAVSASDRYEIDAARLLVSSKVPKIRSFATQMLSDHYRSTKRIMSAARLDGVAVTPPDLDAEQAASIAALKAAPQGKTREDLYLSQQKIAHGATFKMLQNYAVTGDKAHLKQAAANLATVVKRHQHMLRDL